MRLLFLLLVFTVAVKIAQAQTSAPFDAISMPLSSDDFNVRTTNGGILMGISKS